MTIISMTIVVITIVEWNNSCYDKEIAHHHQQRLFSLYILRHL